MFTPYTYFEICTAMKYYHDEAFKMEYLRLCKLAYFLKRTRIKLYHLSFASIPFKIIFSNFLVAFILCFKNVGGNRKCCLLLLLRLRMSECDKYLATFKSTQIRRLRRHYIVKYASAVEHVVEQNNGWFSWYIIS